MKGSGSGPGSSFRYSPLREAHARIERERQERSAPSEVTDRRMERRDRDLERSSGIAESKEQPVADAAPARPELMPARIAVAEGPAPGETQQHYEWRRLTTARIVRDKARRQPAGSTKGTDASPQEREPEE
jgi:hypothetical protein